MKNVNISAMSETEQTETKELFSALDAVDQTAIITVMQSLIQGKPFEEAVEDGNAIRVANGRMPIPYPFPVE